MPPPSPASPENSGPDREAELFFAAAELPDTTARAAFLDQACAGDAALRRRIEALLRAERRADEFFAAHPSGPAVEARHVSASASDPSVNHASASADPLAPPSIPRHRLLEKLGEGGCGVVYRAEQIEPVLREVAIKVIKPGMDTRAVIRRFAAERQSLARMEHPHIARILDAGATAEGRPFFVMELVRGPRITEHCERERLGVEARLRLFIQVCEAIQHAHQKGVIHRDIKPSNILVTSSGGEAAPKVIDFGIAKAISAAPEEATVLTHAHQFIGTPAYMSPEQADADGRDLDTRSDIYALGVLLYELLVGAPPFVREQLESSPETLRKTLRERDPLRPSVKLARRLTATPAAESDPHPTWHGRLARGRAGVSPARIQTHGRDAHATPSLLPTPPVHSANAPAETQPDDTDRARLHERLARLRGDLDAIVMKCLEKDRDRRYESAAALAEDLRRHLAHEPVSARPASRAYQVGKAIRRHRLLFATGAAIALSLLAGGGLSAWQAVRATRANHIAETARAEAELALAEARTARAAAEHEARLARRSAARADARMMITTDLLPEAIERLAEVFALGGQWEDGTLNHGIAIKARRTWSFVARLPPVGPTAPTCFAGSPDAPRLVTCEGEQGERLRVYDLRTSLALGTSTAGIAGAAGAADERVRFLLAGAAPDEVVALTEHAVAVRSLPSLAVLHEAPLADVPTLASGEGDAVLLVLKNGDVRLLDRRTLAPLDAFAWGEQAATRPLGAPRAGDVSPDGRLVLLRGAEWRKGGLLWDRRTRPATFTALPQLVAQQIRFADNHHVALWRDLGDAGALNTGSFEVHELRDKPVLLLRDQVQGADLKGGLALQAWNTGSERAVGGVKETAASVNSADLADDIRLGFIGRAGLFTRNLPQGGVASWATNRYGNLLPTERERPDFLAADLARGWLALRNARGTLVFETGRPFLVAPMSDFCGAITRTGLLTLSHQGFRPESVVLSTLPFDVGAPITRHALQWPADGTWAPWALASVPDQSVAVVLAQETDAESGRPLAAGRVRALVYRPGAPRPTGPGGAPASAAWMIERAFNVAAPVTEVGAPRFATLSPDGSTLLYWTASATAERYDVRDGRALGTLRLGSVVSAARDGHRIAAYTADGRVVVYELATGRTVFERHFGPVDSLCFTTDASRLVVAHEGRIDVLELATGKLVSSLASPLLPVAYPSEGERFLAYLAEDRGVGGSHVLADTRDASVITWISGAQRSFTPTYFSDSGWQLAMIRDRELAILVRAYRPEELVAALETSSPPPGEPTPPPPLDLSRLAEAK
jgi:serine/threonine protein kinase